MCTARFLGTERECLRSGPCRDSLYNKLKETGGVTNPESSDSALEESPDAGTLKLHRPQFISDRESQ